MGWASKYRPKQFSDLVGQDGVVGILTSAIANYYFRDNHKLNGMWMFHGQRGVGKTSAARIFASAINCEPVGSEQGEKMRPCLECTNCKGVATFDSSFIREMDGGLYRGIDEVRNLVGSMNLKSRHFRFFIIDEAHQLTQAASNGLLKIAEDVPEHICIILVTTEAEHILPTLKDRALSLKFERIGDDTMYHHLNKIATIESSVGGGSVNYELLRDSDVIHSIISESDGSLRKAIGLLELAASTVSKSNFLVALANQTYDISYAMAIALLCHDYKKFYEAWGTSVNQNPTERFATLYFEVCKAATRERGVRTRDNERYAGSINAIKIANDLEPIFHILNTVKQISYNELRDLIVCKVNN